MAVAASLGLAFSLATFALCSLIQKVDGPTLRRWRLSRRWDVSRLARELIKAADEPLASLRGLKHMINAWERGARRPSERYWLLYLRVFRECANGETPNGGPKEAGTLAGIAEINTVEADTLSSLSSVDPGDVRALAARVKSLEQQVDGLSKRLEELSSDEPDEGQLRERRTSGSGQWRRNWTPPLWTVLVPSLGA